LQGRKRGIFGSLDAIDYEWIAGVAFVLLFRFL
jgi:hypothetical protein